MYKIEYQQDNGLVTSITDATETPVTLQEEGVAYYKGEIPEDREGFTKELYWGVDPEVNVNTKARIANSETLYAVYTPIEGWLELATMEYVNTELDKKTDKTYTDQKLGEKFDKNKILPTYPSVEPTDNTTVLSAKDAFKKNAEQDAKIVQLEQDVNLFNRRPQGLRFKAGDNSVFAKTMKDLVLGTDDFTVCVVGRGTGISAEGWAYPLLGFSKGIYSTSSMIIRGAENNGLNDIYFQNPLAGNNTHNSIEFNKFDNTTNLHHIVITRSGTLVTCTINGRLVKSVTQDRVLDFSNFIYDIANTSYFWGGAVFNYAMTQAESNKLLWNGGRYDEVRLPEFFFKSESVVRDKLQHGRINISTNIDQVFIAKISYTGLSTNLKLAGFTSDNLYSTEYIVLPSGDNTIYKTFKITSVRDTSLGMYTVGATATTFNMTISRANCLLEYRPENIRSDRYLNSGTAGSDYDLVYSAVKPEIIYDKPYQDVVMLDENKAPDWHPIAMGQEVETPTNIFKAKLPDLGKEWQVSDWKQINN